MKKSLFLFLLISTGSFSQPTDPDVFQDLGYLINDALFFSKRYISPAAEAATFGSSSGWLSSAKKRPIWDVTVGLHSNFFVVPKNNRAFGIKNTDFSFFSIQNATDATVPNALGNDNQVYLIGQLGTEQIKLKTPQGINQDIIIYPHLSANISIWYGTEFLIKFAPITKLKKGDYQVYGVGLKHNLNQHFKWLQNKKINAAGLFCYSSEQINFDFLDSQSSMGNIGINRLSGFIDTFQTQVNVSKEYKKIELLAGLILNVSNDRYEFSGEKGEIENIIPLRSIFNEKLKEISKTRSLVLGEVSCRYEISNVYLQTTLAFGKFVNSNVSIQYEF